VKTERALVHLHAIERGTLLLGALVCGLSFLLFSPRGQFSACVGAALMVLNAWLLKRISVRLYGLFVGQKLSAGRLVLLYNAKLAGLVLLIYLCFRYLPIEPVPFILAVSIFPLAIVLSPLWVPAEAGDPPAAEPGDLHG
jgi:hypothetical protein